VNKKGAGAENRAAAYLQAQGLAIVARNWRGRYGEIDLIAKDGATLVFVEVRERRSLAFGGAAASIGSAKQRKITRTASQYLATLKRTPPCRFDALLISGATGGNGAVQWLRGAFSAD
jgi:putative endonuclease